MHVSQSEKVGQLLPEGVERQLRAQLRSLRFGQPQEYAQLQQLEVRKFLSSKSVHSWLSEWELSHSYGGGSLDRGQQPANNKFNVAVQCTAEEIDEECSPAFFPWTGAANSSRHNGAHSNFVESSNIGWRSSMYRSPFPPLMDASTNTQTTETSATGGMNVYRRASYLEEYAMERVRQLEEEKLAKEMRHGNRGAERKRNRLYNRLGRCLCCWHCRKKEYEHNKDEEDSHSNSTSTKKLSSNGFSQLSTAPRKERRRSENSQNQQQILIKKFTLSRSGGEGWTRGRGESRKCDEVYNCAGMGNYDNVPPLVWSSTAEGGGDSKIMESYNRGHYCFDLVV